jgi:hypothetical protein
MTVYAKKKKSPFPSRYNGNLVCEILTREIESTGGHALSNPINNDP